MIITNLSSRLRASRVPASGWKEAERQRVKEATRALRTHAEKIAWHLAEMASAAPVPVAVSNKHGRASR